MLLVDLCLCYYAHMSKIHEPVAILDEAVRAAKSLPEAAQEALAHEIMEHIEDFAGPVRSTERQTLIAGRVSSALKAVPRAEMMAILRQYNPSL